MLYRHVYGGTEEKQENFIQNRRCPDRDQYDYFSYTSLGRHTSTIKVGFCLFRKLLENYPMSL
jgi:hypothetical protein